MPIANCTISEGSFFEADDSVDLVQLWSELSGQSAEHMTINISLAAKQFGKPYAAVATLLLPSLWVPENRVSIQIGLSKALGQYLRVSESQILVATQILESGQVVERGQELTW